MRSRFFVAAAALLLSFGAGATAQSRYVPHEQWPFLNEDFAPGEVIAGDGSRLVLDKVNIGVGAGNLFYVENDTLKMAGLTPKAVRINGVDYINSQGELMKVLRRTDHGAVLLATRINREAMGRSDVGYGFKSSVSAVEKRDMYEGGNGATLSLRLNQPISQGGAVKNGGAELILVETKFLQFEGGFRVRAIKSDVKGIDGVDKNNLNAFWKAGKVKYSDDDSLAALVEFLYSETR